MKRYLVFAYPQFYPSGGWHDFEGDFKTLEEARDFAQALCKRTYGGDTDIVDLETGEISE